MNNLIIFAVASSCSQDINQPTLIISAVISSLSTLAIGILSNRVLQEDSKARRLEITYCLLILALVVFLAAIFSNKDVNRENNLFWITTVITIGIIAGLLMVIITSRINYLLKERRKQEREEKESRKFNDDFSQIEISYKSEKNINESIKRACNLLNQYRPILLDNKNKNFLFLLIDEIYRNIGSASSPDWIDLVNYVCHSIQSYDDKIKAKALIISAQLNFNNYLKTNRYNSSNSRELKNTWRNQELEKYFELCKHAKENIEKSLNLGENTNFDDIELEEIKLDCLKLQKEISEEDGHLNTIESLKDSNEYIEQLLDKIAVFIRQNSQGNNDSNKTKRIYQKLKQRQCSIYLDLGKVYGRLYKPFRDKSGDNLKHFNDAEYYYKQVKNILQELEETSDKIKFSCFQGLGELFYKVEEYEKALKEFNNLLSEVLKKGNPNDIYQALVWLSKTYYQISNKEKAYCFGMEALIRKLDINAQLNFDEDLEWKKKTLDIAINAKEMNCKHLLPPEIVAQSESRQSLAPESLGCNSKTLS